MTSSADQALVAAVRSAAERLAGWLSRRDAHPADLSACEGPVPDWWRHGLAEAAIFGDGLLSLPTAEKDAFSRPVAFLSAAEVSLTAGGEYVPIAWIDGGHAIAMVHDRGERPVVIAGLQVPGVASAITENGPADEPEYVAESLSEFLTALRPQTVCRFASGNKFATVELSDGCSLLYALGDDVERRQFESDDEVGEFVAEFVVEALDAGMEVVFCPARMRQLIAMRDSAAAEIPPEKRAESAIRSLLIQGNLELACDEDEPDERKREILEDLIDDAGRYLERNQGRVRNLAGAFANWLADHASVEDVYADDDAVQAALTAVESDLDPSVS